MSRENTAEQYLSGFIGAVAGANIARGLSQEAFDEGRVVQGAAIMLAGAAAGALLNINNTNNLYDKTLEEKRTGRETDITNNYAISGMIGIQAGMPFFGDSLTGGAIGVGANFLVNYLNENKANIADEREEGQGFANAVRANEQNVERGNREDFRAQEQLRRRENNRQGNENLTRNSYGRIL